MLENQSAVRDKMTKILDSQLKSKDLKDLIVNGDQKEVILGVSECQKNKIELQGKHILKFLKEVSKA